jgi:hypothetical protein
MKPRRKKTPVRKGFLPNRKPSVRAIVQKSIEQGNWCDDTRHLVNATSASAIGAVGATGSSSLRERRISQSSNTTTIQSIDQPTHLNTRLPCQAPLEIGQSSADFVAHGRLAMLGSSCCLCTARGRRAVGAGTADAAGGLGACQGAFAGVAVVADAAGVGCGLPGGGRGAGERVFGSGLCDAGGLCLLAGQAVQEAGLCGGGG